MNLFNQKVEDIDTSNERVKSPILGHSESCYLKELEIKTERWEELSLEKKIDFVRNVDGRINEVSEQTGLNKDSLFKEFFPEIQTIKTGQHFWDGKSVNGVKYSMQPFVSSTGKIYRGVFPEFPIKREICLPDYCMSDAFWKKYGNGSDRMQMKYATRMLKDELVREPNLKESLNLNDYQYADIMDEKDKISGLTWHHDIDYGRMKLIDEDIHSMKKHQHTGGMATWNDRWIQDHLLADSDMAKVDENIIFDEAACNSKMSPSQLEYISEVLPLKDTDLLIARIDELNRRDDLPPKAIDSDKDLVKLLESIKHEINPLYLEAPQDSVQIEKISETMSSMAGIDYSEWKEISFDNRMEVLQQLENKIAAISHRPACEVCTKNLGNGYIGNYSQDSNKITINIDYIRSNSGDAYIQVLDTLVHEGRHAYQHYNLYVREVHPRQGEVSNWCINEFEYGYKDVQHFGFKVYQMQPVEADARAFAEDVLKSYMSKIA